MFLVPAIMKLLGDDCWWAPRWMKRLQERLGLGETELPDERKRPAVREPARTPRRWSVRARPLRRGRCRRTTRPIRPPRARHGRARRRGSRPPPRTNAPSGRGHDADSHRAPHAESDEPQTTRLSMAKNAVRNAVNNATARRNARRASERRRPRRRRAPREEREIESWLGELRGTGARGRRQPAAPARPSAEPTRAMPEQRPDGSRATTRHGDADDRDPALATAASDDGRRPRPQNADATTAIPTPRKPDAGSGDREAQHPRGREEPKRRGGGGVSAQDLLRREGRL